MPTTLVYLLTTTHARLTLAGELDLDSYVLLQWRLLEALDHDGEALVLDVSAVDLVDCTCLGTIDRARRRLEREGRRLEIAGATTRFARVCATAGYGVLATLAEVGRTAGGSAGSGHRRRDRSHSPRPSPGPTAWPTPRG